MKCKNKKRLLNELAKAAEDPKQFIYTVMSLQNQTAEDVARGANITSQHFYVAMSGLINGHGLTARTCIRLAKGLDIDPYLLGKVLTDYNIKRNITEGEQE